MVPPGGRARSGDAMSVRAYCMRASLVRFRNEPSLLKKVSRRGTAPSRNQLKIGPASLGNCAHMFVTRGFHPSRSSSDVAGGCLRRGVTSRDSVVGR